MRYDSRIADLAPRVTELLLAWRRGDGAALNDLVPLVERALHHIARRAMANERAGHSLQATALVNEVYLRLVEVRRVQWQDRAHFLAIAATLMRRILVDHARARTAGKRGGRAVRVTFDEWALAPTETPRELVALDGALTELARFDQRKSRVVELRVFAGLSLEETAAVLKVSADTVTRDWQFAKAWLRSTLEHE